MSSAHGTKIRVVIVDDSSFYRDLLCDVFSQCQDIHVVGTAGDPYEARQLIKQTNPDVVTLDVEMPGMDGLTFLEKIMTLRPMPVVMVSTLTSRGTETAIAALQIGAVDCVGKPQHVARSGSDHQQKEIKTFASQLVAKVRLAATSQLRAHRQSSGKPLAGGILRANAPALIAIGSSTGGVEALTSILQALPEGLPPIVIVQHMPPLFTASFAARLDKTCAMNVQEAQHGQLLQPGSAYIAPGGVHLRVAGRGALKAELAPGEPVSGHSPSVDVMFKSVAENVGEKSLGIILTGMGKDGAIGLLKMRQAGAETYGQDEASCVVYGMPKAAYELGATEHVLPLARMAEAIYRKCVSHA